MSSRLKEFVNNKPLWDSFLEEVDSYIRIEHRNLEQSKEYGDLREAQGAVRMCRKLKNLRDRVNG